MRTLMESIFTENNFKLSRPDFLMNQDDFFASSTDPLHVGFFLVLFQTEEVDFKELKNLIHQYFSKLKRLPEGYDIAMDKNLSLVVCLKREALTTNEELNRKIFEIEEDPYHFRKLVLPYTLEEVADLKVNYIDENITTGLFKLINNKEKFLEFKKHPVELTAYNLTSRLFIKLPFLSFQGAEEHLVVLADILRSRFVELNLDSLRISSFNLMDELRNLKEEQLVERELIIAKWLKGDKNE
ncbi:hypothetical protein EBB07_15460 [Paenibacillaceae bacterium]|nr:hypothetical protein EBB07_15460 [Paenibacillaceae bacterium]